MQPRILSVREHRLSPLLLLLLAAFSSALNPSRPHLCHTYPLTQRTLSPTLLHSNPNPEPDCYPNLNRHPTPNPNLVKVSVARPLLRRACPHTQRTPPPTLVHPVKQPFSSKDYLESTVSRTVVDEWVALGVPLWATLIDEFLYVFASLIFVVGSLDFYPSTPFEKYIEGCELFIIGSAIFFGLGLFGIFELLLEARISNRKPDLSLLYEQSLYVTGSAFFVVGSILFTPNLESAAVSPAAVPAKEQLLAVPWFGQTITLERGALPEPPDTSLVLGDTLFIVGSMLFAAAAFISALKAAGEVGGDSASTLRRRTAVATASLYEVGSLVYCIGTLGFIPAGPLGITACPDGTRIMSDAGASLFVIGSVLYALGAVVTFLAIAYLTYTGRSDGYASVRGDPSGPSFGLDKVKTFLSPSSDDDGTDEDSIKEDGEGGIESAPLPPQSESAQDQERLLEQQLKHATSALAAAAQTEEELQQDALRALAKASASRSELEEARQILLSQQEKLERMRRQLQLERERQAAKDALDFFT